MVSMEVLGPMATIFWLLIPLEKKTYFKPYPHIKKFMYTPLTDLLVELFNKIIIFLDFLHNLWDFFLLTIQEWFV